MMMAPTAPPQLAGILALLNGLTKVAMGKKVARIVAMLHGMAKAAINKKVAGMVALLPTGAKVTMDKKVAGIKAMLPGVAKVSVEAAKVAGMALVLPAVAKASVEATKVAGLVVLLPAVAQAVLDPNMFGMVSFLTQEAMRRPMVMMAGLGMQHVKALAKAKQKQLKRQCCDRNAPGSNKTSWITSASW